MSDILAAFVDSMWHPREIAALVQFKLTKKGSSNKKTLAESAKTDTNEEFAKLALHKVSRSFALVIQLLDPKLSDAICLFYLILRGLDSVEDDMDYPFELRIPLLRSFHEKLYQEGWNVKDCGDSPDYRILMASFDKIIPLFLALPKEYQEVIADITKRMGAGMADFAEKYNGKDLNGVETVEEYELYCHYVAGLVGLGLDRLFVASGLETYDLGQSEVEANSMGLCLQKVNITRDFLEDWEAKRSWWPKEIWGKYAPDLSYFAKNPHSIRSRLALNNMVYNSFKHIPDVVKYCTKLQDPTIFNFCVVPQVMAIASMALLYNNTEVMTRTLKIRRGITADVAVNCTTLRSVKGFFYRSLSQVKDQLIHPREDPVYKSATDEEMKLAIQLYEEVVEITDKSMDACADHDSINDGWGVICAGLIAVGAAAGAIAYTASSK